MATPQDDEIPDDPAAAWREWVESRPDNLREALEILAPTFDRMTPCWRLRSTSGHYVLRSFHTQLDDDGQHVPNGEVTCSVQHVSGPGSRLLDGAIGIGVFGVPVTDLEQCGCGDFTLESGLEL